MSHLWLEFSHRTLSRIILAASRIRRKLGEEVRFFLIRYKSITEICHDCQCSSLKDKDQQLVWGPLIVSWCLSESMTQRWRHSPKGLHLFHTSLFCGNFTLSYQPHQNTLSSSQSREGECSLQVHRHNNNNFIYKVRQSNSQAKYDGKTRRPKMLNAWIQKQ